MLTTALTTSKPMPSHSENPRSASVSGWLLTIRRNNPKRSTTKPKAINAMALRCQASSVRSAANKTRGSSR